MKVQCLTGFLIAVFSASLHAQTGSINNTLGSGGTFRVKGATSDSLLVVKDNGNVGIGTANPQSVLDVNGQLTADRVKVDGIPSFFARHVDEGSLDSQPYTLISWDETPTSTSDLAAHDNKSNFDPTTGEFTAPRDGFYFVSAHIELSGAGTSGASLYVKIDGDHTGMASFSPTPSGFANLNVAGVVKMASGEILTIQVTKPGSVGSCTAGQGYFSGYLVSDF